MVAGECLDPGLVVGGPLAQDLLAHYRDTEDLAEKVDDLLRPRQSAQVAVNDNAIEAVIDEDEKIAEQLGEQVHDRPARRKSLPSTMRLPGARLMGLRGVRGAVHQGNPQGASDWPARLVLANKEHDEHEHS